MFIEEGDTVFSDTEMSELELQVLKDIQTLIKNGNVNKKFWDQVLSTATKVSRVSSL